MDAEIWPPTQSSVTPLHRLPDYSSEIEFPGKHSEALRFRCRGVLKVLLGSTLEGKEGSRVTQKELLTCDALNQGLLIPWAVAELERPFRVCPVLRQGGQAFVL